jgi:hypothetical protein
MMLLSELFSIEYLDTASSVQDVDKLFDSFNSAVIHDALSPSMKNLKIQIIFIFVNSY